MMTNRAGMMQNTMGKSILTGAFWAISWASWCRCTRISAAWLRRMVPTETPKVSAWRSARMNERSSGSSVRASSACRASARLEPARISPSMRENSSDSGPGTMVTVRARACSKPSPASTLMVRRSRTSGSLRRMASWRSATTRLSQASGPTTPATATKTITASSVVPDRRVIVHTTSHSTGMATIDSTRTTRNWSISSGWPRPASTSLWRSLSR